MVNGEGSYADQIAKQLDPALQINLKGSEFWGESLLSKLIRERKQIPKADRMKLKNDSVDEVDTTDLENWVLKGRPFIEPMEEPEEDMLEYKLFLDSEVSQLDPNFVSEERI